MLGVGQERERERERFDCCGGGAPAGRREEVEVGWGKEIGLVNQTLGGDKQTRV